jgi:ADP-dependent NAD(P)H-hydrate dehydratase / NAD(P)H-hydrate epimerase
VKCVSAIEMVRAEKAAFAAGASGREFMEQAGRAIAEKIEAFVQERGLEWVATLLCGQGNNGGDGYVAGCYLKQMGYCVEAIQLAPFEKCSPLCQENQRRFLELEGRVISLESGDTIPFSEKGVVIDGILGTGFHGAVEGLFAEAISQANESGLPIIAIDIPSGVNGNSGAIEGVAIRADMTLYLGFPKKGFFIGDAWNCVGRLEGVDFGIEERFLDDLQADFNVVTPEEASALLPAIKRTRNKYEAGTVAGWAGSLTMPGAAVLSSFSALRGGAGLVRLYCPKGMEGLLAVAPPELIRVPFEPTEDLPALLNKAKAVFIGPGLGQERAVAEQLVRTLPRIERPCVVDADGLTLLARSGELTLPKEVILTPHAGEFARLVGREGDHLRGEELIRLGREYAEEKGVVLLLKGGPTFIFASGRLPSVIPVGTPGLATAGTGDVLTGLIAALLAQGVKPWEAAILGAYLHGLAGEIASAELTPYGMVASDVIHALPEAFAQLMAVS